MTFGPEEIIWNGETCHICGRRLHRECTKLDEKYFCCEECLGAYLVEKYEEVVSWVDFKTQEEIDERMREAWESN